MGQHYRSPYRATSEGSHPPLPASIPPPLAFYSSTLGKLREVYLNLATECLKFFSTQQEL